MAVLAIDQGTTSTRALRVDAQGSRLTHAIRHRQYLPAAGRVEHDGRELLAAVRRCIDDNVATGIDAIGIDNQGESCLAWHARTREPVGPVIVWQDNRTGDVVERLAAEGAADEVMARAGLPLDSYFSASKLAWILEHVEEARSLRRQGLLRMGTTDAYFLDCLGGRYVTDVTTASRTSLLNLATGQWDETLCTLFGVPMELLPEVVPSTGELARVPVAGGEIPLTASIVDQQASLYGHGCRQPGDAKITFGTGAFALAVTGATPYRAPGQGLLPTIAWQRDGEAPVYALDGGVYSAGAALEWARSLGLFEDYDELNQLHGPGAVDRDLVFVPALTGLACPHWDRRAGGLWLGLAPDTTRQDLVRAILEGIAFRAAEVMRAMSAFVPLSDTLSIDGGIAVNPYFCQFLADVCGRTVQVRDFAELTALGTAALAGATTMDGDPASTRLVPPQRDRRADADRFDEAVRRSANWRRGDAG